MLEPRLAVRQRWWVEGVMLDSLVRYSLNNRIAAFLFAITLGIAGFLAFRDLTVEAFPDPTDTQVQVITLLPGQPTEEVERRLSIPLERALNGTPGLFRLRSVSLFGLSFVTLTFDDGVELLQARQQVLERLREAELPEGVQPELGPLATPIGEVYRYTLGGPGRRSDGAAHAAGLGRAPRDPARARRRRRRLLRRPGARDPRASPIPRGWPRLGVGLDDVFQALSKASGNATGGYVERGAEMFVIRSLGIFADLRDIEKTRVATHDGVPVRIGDVAHVSEGYAPRQGVVTRGENEDAVEGIVLMRRGENPSVVLEGLRARMAEIERMLPNKVKITPFYDRTELVDTTLHTVFHNLLEGALLVVLVLFVFLLSWRASLIVATVIPLSLAASFVYLRARGMSANLLSMGAIDFGIIVDGAVILVEHLFHEVPQAARGLARVIDGEHRAGDARGGAADAVLAADHHRRLHPDLLAAAGRGAHLLADGQHRGERAGRRAGRQLHAGPGAGLLRLARGRARARVPAHALGPQSLRPVARFRAEPPAAGVHRGARGAARRGACSCRGSAPSSCPS